MSGDAPVACIGGGVIGGGWAARFLLYGRDVRLYDPHPEAERRMHEVLENARRAQQALWGGQAPAEGRLVWCADIAETVAGVCHVQESVPEQLDLKRQVYGEIEAGCAPDTPIGSSTSGFKASQLAAGLDRPERLFVAHPFNPVYLLPLVELAKPDAGDDAALQTSAALFRAVGMRPLVLRKEIDAHIADRLMEAVWREALWLVRDGVATTEDVDEAIRLGFGLRWAQMGLFETYRIAGGEAGMAHFLAQFGPALAWPWSRLTDVPDLDATLIERIGRQSDAQSGHRSIRELERLRDENLVAILQALRAADGGRGTGAGAVLNAFAAEGAGAA